MQDKRRIRHPDGREVEVSAVPFRTSLENWNEYFLDDGSVVKLKTVATEILRIEDEWDSDGNPVYIVKSANVMAVSAPENLRRD